jgi:hypothetical protein
MVGGANVELVAIFEKYVLISVTHSHINLREPATGLHFEASFFAIPI